MALQDGASRLEQIDELRARLGIGYQEASALLEQHGGDLVAALVAAEAREAQSQSEPGGRTWDQLWDWLANTATARLQVKKDERVLLDVPFALGLAGAVLAPEAAALSAAACLAGRCDFGLVRAQGSNQKTEESDVYFEPEFEPAEFSEAEQPH